MYYCQPPFFDFSRYSVVNLGVCSYVAKVSRETIELVLSLMGRLSILVDTASATELSIFDSYGETEEVIYVLEQLQNTRERGVSAYTRLSTLLLKISEIQPLATAAMLEMLTKATEQAQATVDAGEATIREAKEDWRNS
jgi:hypothetical protein